MRPRSSTAADSQAVAADPAGHRFVTANAGSGKTKTLIDRVARLLLAGAQPSAILCVTYTKAAAAEMQRRLYDRLGLWAVMDQDALVETLTKLEGRPAASFDDAAVRQARALFARALESPGGLKIQTIHAFCEALLRRFPIEAGIAPGFRVMDDPQAAAIVRAAREQVALKASADAADGEAGMLAEAYARMSVVLDFQSFQSMFATFEGQRGALIGYFQQTGLSSDALVTDVWKRCGFDAPSCEETEAAYAMAAIDRPLWRDAAQVLAGGKVTDQKNAALLAAVAADPNASFDRALAALFTLSGTPAIWVRTTAGLKRREDLREALLLQQDILAEARERIAATTVAQTTIDALILAASYIGAYAEEKARRGVLDFNDLIERTSALLNTREDAVWVLYKLDGGIEHLLLDEAQDTAFEQWNIIEALTVEFGAGAGVRDTARTLFVVGDVKQSIYSFQGANPDLFLARRTAWLDNFRAAGIDAQSVELNTSFRSTPEVLAFVDAVFLTEEFRAGLSSDPAKVTHEAFRTDGPGCVDLWDLVREPKMPERVAWDAPLDTPDAQGANRRLADQIAAEIKALVARGDAVFEGDDKPPRPASFGDVLILVRRRGVLFEEILRALKRADVPVAGADRLKLSGHIAFDDLIALARFCLFPDDDLTLAALLKSPLTGLKDEDLYALAKPRGESSLWTVLQQRAGEVAAWSEALETLIWARGQAQRRPPFEFFGTVLDRIAADGRSMHQRFLSRLGPEAQDALAEFMAQTAAAEARGVRDLETLADDFAGLDIVVKREMGAARGEVRVMTAHGAKGLEAPIVILPEIAFPGGGRSSPLLRDDNPHLGAGFLWCPSKDSDCGASGAARLAREKAEADEALRLLYVALTRARDRLILCGRVAADAKEENLKGWYRALRAAFQQEGMVSGLRQGASSDQTFTRFGADPRALGTAVAVAPPAVTLPTWTQDPPPLESPAWRYAQPSRAADAEPRVAPSPLAQSQGLGRYRRGEIIHRLLQLLPDVAPDARAAAAENLLSKERLTDPQRAEMAAAALGVLQDPAFAAVFALGSRPEAAIAGTAPELPPSLRISGRVDRLAVTDERVLVVDFKTNRPAPTRLGGPDDPYVQQMALYWAVLRRLFPGRAVEAALVWTDGPKLMTVPEDLMAQALETLASRVDQ